jgi:hypothetical protein
MNFLLNYSQEVEIAIELAWGRERCMLVAFAVRALEMVFMVGVIGCVFVLLLTTVEDIQTLFTGEKER